MQTIKIKKLLGFKIVLFCVFIKKNLLKIYFCKELIKSEVEDERNKIEF